MYQNKKCKSYKSLTGRYIVLFFIKFYNVLLNCNFCLFIFKVYLFYQDVSYNLQVNYLYLDHCWPILKSTF